MIESHMRDIETSSTWTSGGRFSKVPKHFGGISGTQISLYLQNEGVSRHETLQLF